MSDKFTDIQNLIDYLGRNSEPEPHVSMEDEKVRSKRLANKDFEKAIEHRHTLVCWMMWVVSIWLLVVGCIIAVQIFLLHGLSDTVLCTLLSTTTINVLGLAVIVLRGSFNSNNKNQDEE